MSASDDEVLVQVHAASVNPVDFKIRDGVLRLLINYRMPIVLGFDFAGTVAQVGRAVTGFQVGDQVFYGKFGGTEVTLDGENVLILRADDIYAVVE